jgi:Uroporphyrinogen decarboxylase (URO-D)
MIECMKKRLTEAYESPTRKAVFYSANGATTGSLSLNATPFWDWTPQRSATVPGVSTCLFPLAFGCESLLFDDDKEWVKPRFTHPEQVYDCELPSVSQSRTGKVIETIRALLKTLPEDELIREPDIQSPLGVAEMMWDDSFYMALIDAAEAVHVLLDKITTFIIGFIQEIHRQTADRLNPAGFPLIWARGRGTMISDDSMSLVSPAMHREFSIPYLNRIADACGPLWYHSCTWRKPYFENLRLLRNVCCWNWNPGNSDDPAAIIDAFSGTAVIAPHIVKNMHRDNDLLRFGFADECDLIEYFLDSMKSDTVLYFWLSNVINDGPLAERIHKLMHSRGHSPMGTLGPEPLP